MPRLAACEFITRPQELILNYSFMQENYEQRFFNSRFEAEAVSG